MDLTCEVIDMNAINNVSSIGSDMNNVNPFQSADGSQSPNMDAKVITESLKVKQENSSLQDSKKGSEEELLSKMIDELAKQYQSRGTNLNFSIDKDTHALVVKVIDSESDKVIRQIPPDEILALRKRLQSLIGKLLDKEA